MRTVKQKGRIITKALIKAEGKTAVYDTVMAQFASMMDRDDSVVSYRISVPIEAEGLSTAYATDFVATMRDGTVMAVECIPEKNLRRQKYIREMAVSYAYWSAVGYKWKMVVGTSAKRKGGENHD